MLILNLLERAFVGLQVFEGIFRSYIFFTIWFIIITFQVGIWSSFSY